MKRGRRNGIDASSQPMSTFLIKNSCYKDVPNAGDAGTSFRLFIVVKNA